jgi:hypothetical protein
VHDRRDRAGAVFACVVAGRADAFDAVHEAARFLASRGRHLDDARRARFFVEHEQIGERAPHVDTDDD